ncbi:MAG: hypothetical protein LUM44_03605 [Pyrinomonadaceae bacterium]|nr:hypothetical protein [Pyrinomonadaceae bacterium]
MAENNNSEVKEKPSIRDWVAFLISIISILGLVGISIAIFTLLKGEVEGNTVIGRDTDKIMTVFTTLVALIGSWVGTILAFYFSRENFESATRNVTALVNQMSPQEKLKSIPVKEKMEPPERIFSVKLPAEQNLLATMLKDLEATRRGNRIPVLSESNFPANIVHKSTIVEFLFERSRAVVSPPQDTNALTLKDLLDDPEMIKRANNFVIVKEDATLADAKAALDKQFGCQDVFVTKNGTKDEPLLGWITNIKIAESSVV